MNVQKSSYDASVNMFLVEIESKVSRKHYHLRLFYIYLKIKKVYKDISDEPFHKKFKSSKIKLISFHTVIP
jgi:hypothetical protein